MLILQTVMFSAAAYAESLPHGSDTESVIESDLPNAEEPSSESDVESVQDDAATEVASEPEVLENIVARAAGPTDKTAVLTGANSTFAVEVSQGGSTVQSGGTIQGRLPLTLKLADLRVLVNGDDPDPTNADPASYIQKGDWVELKREDYFKEVVLPTANRVLNAQTESGVKPLGTVYFTPNSIRIVFNGDDNFFNGVGRGVVLSFETTAEADITGMEYGDTKPISIFGQAYELKNPDVTPGYSITLTGNNWPKTKSWTWWYVTVPAYQDGYLTFESTPSSFDVLDPTIKLPLDGMTYYTKPSDYRMVYVPGSFKVNGSQVHPSIDEDGGLSYVFPTGTGVEPKVEYQAWFHKDLYYKEYRNVSIDPGRNNGQRFDPKADLKDTNDEVKASVTRETWIAPDWIQASGSYDHPSETITWKIVVNQYNKKGLQNFTITNALPAGLDFVSAKWQAWEDGVATEEQSIVPDADGVYSFGTVNGRVELVIQSKVTTGSSFTINPRANWTLNTPGGIQDNDVTSGLKPAAVTDDAIITIGAHAFTKAGSISTEDYNLGGITWTVTLTPQYALPNAAVYDVLVHGGDLNVLDNAVDATGEVDSQTIAKIKQNLNTAQLWKQYHEGTLKSGDGLTLKVIPLTVDGKVVADLIKVTGYTDTAASFSFRSLETSPDILFRQDATSTNKTRWNRALLVDGAVVKSAQISVNLHLRMLNKDMLFASKPLKEDGTLENVKPNDVSSYIRNDDNAAWTLSAYDRTTKTVTFRLGVNMPGYNTEEMAKQGGSRVISNIRLVDTLPDGWEFVPFSDDKEFELWEGSSGNGGGTEYGIRNDAKTVIEPGTTAHVVSFSHSGNVGTFTFSKLESPYVILVKARPSNTALEKYLEEYLTGGTDKQVLYNKADLHMTWGGEEKVVTEQRKMIVPVQTLGKSVSKPVPGVLEWTVNYTPPFNMEQGVYLQDTLGAGMNPRYDSSGELVLTSPSMAVYPAELTASGALKRVGAALDLSDPDAEVQVKAEPGAEGTTVLTFKMKDPNKFYQFVYQTEVDPKKAKPGDKMGNEVKLEGDDKLKSVSAKSESTLDSADVAGSSTSNALLPLTKVDPEGNPLSGVEFTLYKKNDGTQVAKGTTGTGGKLNLLFPDPGYYELKETYIDTTTWLPTTRIYQVYVGNTPGKPIWVDGVKVGSDDPLVVPTPAQGKLTISNKVEGNGADVFKGFEYTVTFTGTGNDREYAYKKSDGTSGTLKSGDKFTLKHGEAVTLPALPEGLVYAVTQAEYTIIDGYTTTPETREYSGSIEYKGDHKADFINERMVAKLTISNKVMGNGGNKTRDFEYTVSFEDTGKDGSYTYEKSDGNTGTIQSGDSFQLKDGETLDILNLPEHLSYKVTQKDYTADGYATSPQELVGTGVMKGEDELAPFTNTRVIHGGLLISNTVKGKEDDKQKLFEYTVVFTGEGSDASYGYEKSDGSKGTLKSGDHFELTDGQTLVVQGLPTYLAYTVTQEAYTADGYVTDPASLVRTGTIPEKQVAEAHYVTVRPYLEGVLRDNNTGEVIPNAPLTVTDLKTGKSTETVTNEKGEYSAPAVADTDYTITYTKKYQVGGTEVPVAFTQKANVAGGVTEETVPADITAVGIVMLKQPNGATELFNAALTSHLRIYLKDKDGMYLEENGTPKAYPMGANGTFSVEGLSEQKYTMEVRYQADTGEELLLQVAELDVKANGELNISEELVDPYGTVYDETTGDAISGTKIAGAKVTLYYADTQRNRDKGRTPDTEVTLPAVPNFPPHDNKSPEQDSDANGFYAYMVFPEADYYLVVTKSGYETHTSATISVDYAIVRYDVPMKPAPVLNKLTISNKVMGNGGNKTRDFEYTVSFEDTGKDGSYTYVKSDGSTGTIQSGDSFQLKDGETLDILNLPEHLSYQVTQKDYTADGYVTSPQELVGTGVMKGEDELAPFTNTRVIHGGLLISNTVKGKEDDKQKLFEYTVVFTGEGSDASYGYEKSDGSKGTLKSGDHFELTDGQTLVVQGLPTYLAYTVTQEAYTADGYVTDPASLVRTGTIPEKQVAEAHYVTVRPYLEGVLRDNNTGEVIPNAPLTVTDLKTGKSTETVTNEKGEYSVPAVADTDYTITYTKKYQVGGTEVPVAFTQKANVAGGVTEETVPADITAVGIVMLKQPNGATELFNAALTSHLRIYLKDKDGMYLEENGTPKAYPMGANGTFSVEGLSEQKYTMEVRYQADTGEELLLKVAELDVKANGELNISEELVDPYGTVYDETTGDAISGTKIAGAKVTLYYADTQRNRDKGRTPGTEVTLPAVPNFPPHDNKSPEQDSDANGFYAYMVFPEADYYLVVTKSGYYTHRSATISVDYDIVRYDVPMKPEPKPVLSKLTISNKVMGNGGDKTRAFEYIVSFEDTGKDGSYTYVKSDGSTGTIQSGDSFQLKDGETLDILNLPEHLSYKVTQKDYTADGYVTSPQELVGTGVMKGEDELAPFTNTRVIHGGLLISNTVKGKEDDKQKLFEYTVVFTGEGSDASYGYEKSDGSKGTLKSGDHFELTDGQTLVVQGLPTYLAYTVTQEAYTADGYVTDPASLVRTGTIPEKQVAEAHYVTVRPYLEGVLRDNNTGEVIPNAPLTVTDLKTGKSTETVTNEKGEYSAPAVADTDYTITYTKKYQVGGTEVPVAFTQKANVAGGVTEETVPADITAVGIVMLKQPNGATELFNAALTSHLRIYLKDKDGMYLEENGTPKAYPMGANGTFSVEGLSEQKYTMEVRYQADTGEELLLKIAELDVKANGELNISEELVDPYGTVYDETTGDAVSGKKIAGAKVTLYYADTQRNRDKGRTPGTEVTLPAVPNFPPHDNKSPEQDSDANGFYAYMVFPEADYYLVVTKSGYYTHRSATISVDYDIVRYDVPMKPIRYSNENSGGSDNEGTGGNNEETGGNNEGTGGNNEGTGGNNEGTGGNNEGTGGNNEGTGGNNEGTGGNNEGTGGNNEGAGGDNEGTGGDNEGTGGDNEGAGGDNGGTGGNNEGTGGNNEGAGGDNEGAGGNNEGAGNGNNGTDETIHVDSELDDAPVTGDNSVSPLIYMALALMSLVTIGLCVRGNKKNKLIQ
ncbi:DUF7601 domain-containing protein [Paenibacillus sp. SYP-B4298]|uniref:DUF7601 domain-containing protein n=1 Tax=Paenibacillus sp. SYP-B4298 TaxID=2996034 RepID=UPI0022DE0B49|nr:carboxypeptidase regulatory-like domain-containing protein [Paenibacillus sp. SYP-B4298]